MEVMRWVLVGIIGILTGVVAFLINISVKYLFQVKYNLFDKRTFLEISNNIYCCYCNIIKMLLFLSMLAVYDTEHKQGEIIYGFLILLGFNVLFAIIASTLVAFEVRINLVFYKP